MKLNTRNIGGKYYTEYVAKRGERLNQIAREQLHDEKLASGIYRVNNNVPEIKPISQNDDLTGWILLLPPLTEDFLAKNPNAKKALSDLKARADQGTLTAEDYYAQRKLVLSVL
jgi:hypothetical protein